MMKCYSPQRMLSLNLLTKANWYMFNTYQNDNSLYQYILIDVRMIFLYIVGLQEQGIILPRVNNIRDCSANVAAAVGIAAMETGVHISTTFH